MRKIEVVLADDLDGSTNDVETVEIQVNGEKHTVDLNKRHRADLKKALARYINAAQQNENNVPIRAAADPEDRKTYNAEVRAWARKHNVEVPERGRVPRSVIEQYENYERNHTHVG